MRSRSGARRLPPADVVAPAALAASAVALLALVWAMVTRPFFYNEQWRAWHLVLPEMPWVVSEGTDAPIAFGYAALSKLTAVAFGGGEVALRLPSLVSLPVLALLTYRLARCWTGVLAAVLATAALLANRMVLTFAAELAPYTVEAACTAGALLLWLDADEPDRTPRERWLRYGGLAVLTLIATPLVLVLAGLFVLDLVRAWRTRDPGYVAPAAAVSLVGGVHGIAYVGIQTSQVHGPYWQSTFLGGSPWDVARGIWRGLASYVPNALTGGTGHFPSVPDGEIAFPGGLRAVLMVAMVAALVAGFAATLREPAARPLPVALLGCVAAQVVASLAHRWPFAFTRVNTFLLPLLYVLVAVGASRVFGLWRGRTYRAAVAVAGVAAYALVAAVGVRQVATVRAEGQQPAYGTRLPDLVARVRLRADASDLVVLQHEMTPKGWEYYMDRASGGLYVPPDRTVTLNAREVRVEPLRRLLDAHPGTKRVFLVALAGSSPAPIRAVHEELTARGYVETASWREVATGGMREYTRP